MRKFDDFLGRHWEWILVGALLIGSILYMSKCNLDKQEKNGVEVARDFEKEKLDSSVIAYWKDRYNKEHSTVTSLSAVNTTKSEYLDSMANLLSIARKQIKDIEVMRSEMTLNEEPVSSNDYFTEITQKLDPQLKSISFNWSDKWTAVDGKVMANGIGNKIHIESIDTITSVAYWKRSKILGLRIGKQEGYVDYSNANTHNSITGGKRLELTPPKQRYSLNLSINAGYNPFMNNFNLMKPQFTIGLSIGKALIKF